MNNYSIDYGLTEQTERYDSLTGKAGRSDSTYFDKIMGLSREDLNKKFEELVERLKYLKKYINSNSSYELEEAIDKYHNDLFEHSNIEKNVEKFLKFLTQNQQQAGYILYSTLYITTDKLPDSDKKLINNKLEQILEEVSKQLSNFDLDFSKKYGIKGNHYIKDFFQELKSYFEKNPNPIKNNNSQINNSLSF